MVDATHNFNFPLYMIATLLVTGGLVWLNVNPEKTVTCKVYEPAIAMGV